jgi:hypothetical protein
MACRGRRVLQIGACVTLATAVTLDLMPDGERRRSVSDNSPMTAEILLGHRTQAQRWIRERAEGHGRSGRTAGAHRR